MGRPYVRCCKPIMRAYGSRWQWTHSNYCASFPKQRIERSDPKVTAWNASPQVGPMTEDAAYVDAHVDDGSDDANG